ncbi:Serpentine receptor class r-10 [Caenorhabditis elegans]|uniref:Serpentine receptor class r-10 n=1 Tax=Caenorhabditis elegans TaxID=6239 RepID=Q93797_CAEEL|nr:Seven TM Receptor [Caenorhabditis elegans]CAB02127.2 Seven TM Receptor [Caenorhabditis elegans]|eukprot:NP_506425.2 Seven TM Receptor [Caenorhabditis elegans]
MTNYEILKSAVQWISFVFSICFNSILIFLIITQSPKKMGNYRYLMIYFSCFAMFFSTIDVIVAPFIHTHGTSATVLMRRSDSDTIVNLQYVLLILLCSCFGVTITFFAIHFVFRYFALERKGRISYFDGPRLIVWIAVPMFFGIIWGTTVLFFALPTDETTELIRESVMKHYNLEMEDVIYVGASYYRRKSDGTLEMIVSSFIAASIFFTMMGTSFSVVCYYGVLSYRRIANLQNEGESEFTKNLQKQLLKALFLQALIPILLMYLPVGTYMTLPALNLDSEEFSKFVTLLYAIYPAIDPLPLFFVIDNYRIALKGYFLGCPGNQNRVSVAGSDN